MAANVPGSTERAQQDLELLRFSKHPSMGRPNGGLLWVWFETPRTLSDDLAVVTRSGNGPGSENNTKRSNTFEGREHTASTRGHERRIFRGESEGDAGLARSCSTPELFPLAPVSVTQAQSSGHFAIFTSAGAIWSFRRPSEHIGDSTGAPCVLVLSTPATHSLTRDHWMISSALRSRDCGIVRPIALAVLRLMTSSNFVGCSTGRSPGFEPLRILST